MDKDTDIVQAWAQRVEAAPYLAERQTAYCLKLGSDEGRSWRLTIGSQSSLKPSVDYPLNIPTLTLEPATAQALAEDQLTPQRALFERKLKLRMSASEALRLNLFFKHVLPHA